MVLLTVGSGCTFIYNDLFSCYPAWREIRCLAKHRGRLRQKKSPWWFWADYLDFLSRPRLSTRALVGDLDKNVDYYCNRYCCCGEGRRWSWWGQAEVDLVFPLPPPTERALLRRVKRENGFPPSLFVVYCVMASTFFSPGFPLVCQHCMNANFSLRKVCRRKEYFCLVGHCSQMKLTSICQRQATAERYDYLPPNLPARCLNLFLSLHALLAMTPWKMDWWILLTWLSVCIPSFRHSNIVTW